MSAEESVDLNVFKHDEQAPDFCADCESCIVLKRLMTALRYYSLLNVRNDANALHIFEQFLFETYTQSAIINDHTHLMIAHSDAKQIEQIQTYFVETVKLFPTPCDLSTCTYTARHHQVVKEQQKATVQLDRRTNFYAVLLDGIHFYVFHIFDVGLRVKESQKIGGDEEDEKEKQAAVAQHFDAALYRMHRAIQQRQHLTNSFDRFNTAQNTKFMLQINNIEDENEQKNKNGQTKLDEFCMYLRRMRVDKESMDRFLSFIAEQEYDTEAIDADFKQGAADGNIANYVRNQGCSDALKRALASSNASRSSFSTGLRFYYWPKFRDLHELPTHTEQSSNINDHCGFAVRDLSVTAKHSSFKEELCEYRAGNWSLQIYNDRVRVKALEFGNSNIVKATTAFNDAYDNGSLIYYGIPSRAVLRYSNLVCLILYCDYSALSADFSASFRKRDALETLQQIKRRNQNYYWWAKTLRETVEVFGKQYYGYDLFGGTPASEAHRYLLGPFYCGISCTLKLPQFTIRLNGPTSTSKAEEVALKFAGGGKKGMMLKLNNDQGLAQYVRGFNCCWISRYREEDERLFFGGYFVLNVVTVILMKSHQNFEPHIRAICYLDKTLNGDDLDGFKVSEWDSMMLRAWFACVSGGVRIRVRSRWRVGPYIARTFIHYARSKSHIHLNLNALYYHYYANKNMRGLVMNAMDRRSGKSEDDLRDFSKRKGNDLRNVPRLDALLKVFSNLDSVTLTTTSFNGEHFHSFSLLSVLQQITGSLLSKVEIKAVVVRGTGSKCWLDELWEDEEYKNKVICAFQQANYQIGLKEKLVNRVKQVERRCIIRKE